MNSLAITAQKTEELDKQIADCIQTEFRPTLAVVFCCIMQDITALQAIFNKYHISFIGCTSAGEICDGIPLEGSITCLLLYPAEGLFEIFTGSDKSETTYQQAYEVAQFASDRFTEPATIVFSNGFPVHADQIISGLRDAFGSLERPIFGGLAGGDQHLERTLVFSNDTIAERAVYALIFDGRRVQCRGLAISGWEAIGPVHTITKARDNVVYTIDDQPALPFYIRHFGYFGSVNIEQQAVDDLSLQYPLQILREHGNRVLRSPMKGNEEDGSLMLAASVQEGDQFRFSMSPGFNVIDQTIAEFRAFHEQNPSADALILFSCKGRHSALGPFIVDEISGIYNQWKQPMVGFFSFGELGVDKQGYCDFHNETCSLLLLHEKE